MDTEWNWAGNYAYGATAIHRPTSVAATQELVARLTQVRALGSRHSFNDVADSPGELISLQQLPREITFSQQGSTVTVDGGITYGELATALCQQGYALANLASLPHISVAGACQTGTHGSGIANQSLAAAVSAMTMITSSGALVTVAGEDADFAGRVVGLGAAGLITSLTLAVEPAFEVATTVYTGLRWETMLDQLEALLAVAYSVSIFVEWSDPDRSQVFVKSRTDTETTQPEQLFGALPADRPLHPVRGVEAIGCTEQLGRPGLWCDRLPHFRLDFVPSTGQELQSEYLVSREDGPAALHALRGIEAELAELAQTMEIRSVAADGLWLSPAYQRDCVGLHFTWIKDQARVLALLPNLERLLQPFDARPHWGKLFVTPAKRLAELFPRMGDFVELVRTCDPYRKFANAYLRRVTGYDS